MKSFISNLIDKFTTKKENQHLDDSLPIKGRVDINKSICPSCSSIIEEIPKYSGTCKACKNKFYIEQHRITEKKYIVDEEQKKVFSIIYHALKNNTNGTGIVISDYIKQYKKYTGNDVDFIWFVLNNELRKAALDNDDGFQTDLYFKMAEVLISEGKSTYHIRKAIVMVELNSVKRTGIAKKVEIIQTDDCPESMLIKNKWVSLNTEIKNPRIPIQNCSRRTGCICGYSYNT